MSSIYVDNLVFSRHILMSLFTVHPDFFMNVFIFPANSCSSTYLSDVLHDMIYQNIQGICEVRDADDFPCRSRLVRVFIYSPFITLFSFR